MQARQMGGSPSDNEQHDDDGTLPASQAEDFNPVETSSVDDRLLQQQILNNNEYWGTPV
jgi:hypothetical protein